MKFLKNLFKKAIICPYCNYAFSEMPTRKRKCPECKEVIFRKRLPTDTAMRLVTEKEAIAIDSVWEDLNDQNEEAELKEAMFNFETRLQERDYGGFERACSNIGWHYYYSDKNYQKALNYYLIAIYFAMNGAHSNRFDYLRPILVPGLKNPYLNIVEELKIDAFSIQKKFVMLNKVYELQNNMPIAPEDAWYTFVDLLHN